MIVGGDGLGLFIYLIYFSSFSLVSWWRFGTWDQKRNCFHGGVKRATPSSI